MPEAIRVGAFVSCPLEEKTMNTQSKVNVAANAERWAGVDEGRMTAQRSGGGFLKLLMFPLIAVAALIFAAAELAK
jgi:hypothetical protein